MDNCLRVCFLLALLCGLSTSSLCYANHPVLVEGESDFDGDGLLGTDEDLDGDRVFGTLSVALAADLKNTRHTVPGFLPGIVFSELPSKSTRLASFRTGRSTWGRAFVCTIRRLVFAVVRRVI